MGEREFKKNSILEKPKKYFSSAVVMKCDQLWTEEDSRASLLLNKKIEPKEKFDWREKNSLQWSCWCQTQVCWAPFNPLKLFLVECLEVEVVVFSLFVGHRGCNFDSFWSLGKNAIINRTLQWSTPGVESLGGSRHSSLSKHMLSDFCQLKNAKTKCSMTWTFHEVEPWVVEPFSWRILRW